MNHLALGINKLGVGHFRGLEPARLLWTIGLKAHPIHTEAAQKFLGFRR